MSKRVLNIAVIALLLINMATLAMLWMKSGKSKGHHHHKGDPISNTLKNEVGFNDDQLASFEELKEAHRQKMKDIHHDNQDLRQKLHSTDAIDLELADSLSTRLGQNIATLELATWQHFQDIRGLCNEEQKGKIDALLHDIARKLGPPPPGHRPGRR